MKLYSLQLSLSSSNSSAPSGPPTEVIAMATSPVSIIIQWSHVACINRNSNITEYTVHYSTYYGSPVDVSVPGTGQSERTYTATLLALTTTYSIQVAAVTNTGVTVYEITPPPRSESV